MSETPLKVESIFHPSDFSEASEVAFAHALKIAIAAKATLTMLHVDETASTEWQDFPGVRATLERWGLIDKDSHGAVARLGIGVEKVIARSDDPIKACLDFLEKHPTDLIVLAIRRDADRTRWLEKSVAESMTRGASEMTLFIPHGSEGFVSRQDGTMSLKNVLIPITNKPRPQPAIDATARLIKNLELPPGIVTLLHVGTAGDAPAVRTPDNTKWTWNRVTKAGEPHRTIVETANELHADLIVMTTEGPHGFLDALRGSTSERVLSEATCPVASLPVGSLLG